MLLTSEVADEVTLARMLAAVERLEEMLLSEEEAEESWAKVPATAAAMERMRALEKYMVVSGGAVDGLRSG